jgi:hypothetical protein
MFIDQLAMIEEKTRGNLTSEESTVLRNALASLQMAFVEASQAGRPANGGGPSAESTPAPPAAATEAPAQTPNDAPSVSGPESESKKKFSKSYGA